MKKTTTKPTKGHDFSKRNKVSVWVSQHPYKDIPDNYFEESFTKNNTRAKNTWSNNFKLLYFKPDNMETNGSHNDSINIKQAAGECSFSSSYIEVLMSKARKNKIDKVTWMILLFELEYSTKLTGINKDDYVTFLGAFDYDDDSDNLYQPKDE